MQCCPASSISAIDELTHVCPPLLLYPFQNVLYQHDCKTTTKSATKPKIHQPPLRLGFAIQSLHDEAASDAKNLTPYHTAPDDTTQRGQLSAAQTNASATHIDAREREIAILDRSASSSDPLLIPLALRRPLRFRHVPARAPNVRNRTNQWHPSFQLHDERTDHFARFSHSSHLEGLGLSMSASFSDSSHAKRWLLHGKIAGSVQVAY
jgi:hypothetical protein